MIVAFALQPLFGGELRVALSLANHAWVKRLERPEMQLARPLPQQVALVEEADLAGAQYKARLHYVVWVNLRPRLPPTLVCAGFRHENHVEADASVRGQIFNENLGTWLLLKQDVVLDLLVFPEAPVCAWLVKSEHVRAGIEADLVAYEVRLAVSKHG